MKKEVIFTKNDLKEFIEECKELRAGESNQFQEGKTKLNTQGGPPWK